MQLWQLTPPARIWPPSPGLWCRTHAKYLGLALLHLSLEIMFKDFKAAAARRAARVALPVLLMAAVESGRRSGLPV